MPCRYPVIQWFYNIHINMMKLNNDLIAKYTFCDHICIHRSRYSITLFYLFPYQNDMINSLQRVFKVESSPSLKKIQLHISYLLSFPSPFSDTYGYVGVSECGDNICYSLKFMAGKLPELTPCPFCYSAIIA